MPVQRKTCTQGLHPVMLEKGMMEMQKKTLIPKLVMTIAVGLLILSVMLVYQWYGAYQDEKDAIQRQRQQLYQSQVIEPVAGDNHQQQVIGLVDMYNENSIEDAMTVVENAVKDVMRLQEQHQTIAYELGSNGGDIDVYLPLFQETKAALTAYFGSGKISEPWYSWSSEDFPNVKWSYQVFKDYQSGKFPVGWFCRAEDGTILAYVFGKYDMSAKKFVDYEMFVTRQGMACASYTSSEQGEDTPPESTVDIDSFLEGVEGLAGVKLPGETETEGGDD